MAVVIQGRELGWNLCMPRNQHRRQHWSKAETTKGTTSAPTPGTDTASSPTMSHLLCPSPDTHISSQERGYTWCFHSLIVIWIHADFILFHVEGIFAHLHGPQLVVTVEIWPSPQPAIDDMGEPLAVRHLQATIQ